MLGKARRKALAKTKQNLSEGERERMTEERCVCESVFERETEIERMVKLNI